VVSGSGVAAFRPGAPLLAPGAPGASAGSGAPGAPTGVSVAASDPLWRGLGAKRPRGLAWPPRSLAGGDTILLPVTVAVSWLGPSP